MIRVIITGPPSGTGYFPYRIEAWAQGRPRFVGLSRDPLLDACRQLKQYGLMDDTVVGLFDGDAENWDKRTTVGVGALQRASSSERAGSPVRYSEGAGTPTPDKIEEAVMAPYREFPGGPIKDIGPPTAAQPAIPVEPPPPPRTPPKPPDDTDRAAPKRAKSGKSHHRPRPKGSGGHRGRQLGR